MKYKLSSDTWDLSERDAIERVIESNRFTMGPEVAQYEKNFSEYNQSKYTVMVSSGSAANLLMVAAMFLTRDPSRQLKRGDEVIVPAVSWSTTYFPLQQYGLKLKFVDIDKETLNIDIHKLRDAISDKTKLIMAVNLLGNPNDFESIFDLIQDRDITLLEDNCESLGATFQNKKTGTFGLMGSYSSFFSHHIATMEGGCIVTDDEELFHILLSIRAHGWTRDLPEENLICEKSSDPFQESFRFILPGYNVRPLEMSGAIGIEQLKKLPSFIINRRKNAKYFQKIFKQLPFLNIQKEIGKSSWFGFSILISQDAPFSRVDLVRELDNSQIECRPIVTGNFLKNKEVLEHFDYTISGELEGAEFIDSNGLFVGNHHENLVSNLDYLKDKVLSLSSKLTSK